MKQYSVFHVPVLSFFSKALYRDVGLQWKGTGFAYLLLLLAICWIPVIIKHQVIFSNFVDNEAPKIINQIPRITITNGKVSLEEPQPYYIKDPDTDEILIIIDTTGAVTSLENSKAIGLITKTKGIFKKNDFETRTFDLNNINKFIFDQNKIKRWLNTIKKILVPVFFPLAVLGSFLVRIIQLLIYAAIGMLFAYWCKLKGTYRLFLRLAAAAVTPAIIIKTILGIASIKLPLAGLWYFFCAMAYLFFCVKVIAQAQETQHVNTPDQKSLT
jgi:hypothetical protein